MDLIALQFPAVGVRFLGDINAQRDDLGLHLPKQCRIVEGSLFHVLAGQTPVGMKVDKEGELSLFRHTGGIGVFAVPAVFEESAFGVG